MNSSSNNMQCMVTPLVWCSRPQVEEGAPYIWDISAIWNGETAFAIDWDPAPAVGFTIISCQVERRINGVDSGTVFLRGAVLGSPFMYSDSGDGAAMAAGSVLTYRVRYITAEEGTGPWGVWAICRSYLESVVDPEGGPAGVLDPETGGRVVDPETV